MITELTQGEFLQTMRRRKCQTSEEVAFIIREAKWKYIQLLEFDLKEIELMQLIKLFPEIESKDLVKFHKGKKYDLDMQNNELLWLWMRREKCSGLTLGKKLKVSNQTISFWVTGAYIPRVEKYKDYQKLLEKITDGFVKKENWR